jgi:hypothetical protein
MKRFSLFVVLLSANLTYAQNYIGFRNTLSEASFWFYEQQFDSALVYFSKAEKYNLVFFAEEAHLYSRTLWEQGYRKKSIKILLKHGFSDFFIHDTTYYLGLEKSSRLRIARKLKSVEKDLLYGNMDFYDSLHKKDQMYRQVILQYPYNSFEHDSIRDLMVHQDSLNFLELISDIKKNGYPGGYKMAPVGPGAVLIHAKPEWLLNYSFLFHKEIEGGRMSMHDYSKAFDRAMTKIGNAKFKPYNAYFPTSDETILSPFLVFYTRCLIGMSPYYDIYIPRSYRRGASPPKSAFYDFYKARKENFNCIRIKQ